MQIKEESKMKLKVGQCACAKNYRKYCRTKKGYRFMKGRCNTPGRKL